LGSFQAGQDFRPPPGWERNFDADMFANEGLDLADLFASFVGGKGHGRGGKMPIPGQDFEVDAQISLEQAYTGTELDLKLNIPETDASGLVRKTSKTLKVRIPKGATDGQRLRLAGRGGKGVNDSKSGDLYLNIRLYPHSLFRVEGYDLYLDLPLTPWEAVLGASVQVPTLGGDVRLKVPPGTSSGQQMRIAGRGLPKPLGGGGDLFIVIQIAVPPQVSERERGLYQALAEGSGFNPRGHFRRS
jgi:curved DNA-binding protein